MRRAPARRSIALLLGALWTSCGTYVGSEAILRNVSANCSVFDRRAIEVIAKDGVPLRGWLIQASESRAVCLYFYGNGENLCISKQRLEWLSDCLGLTVICFDYRGYGFSSGTSSLRQLARDQRTVYAFAQAYSQKSALPLVVFGRSFGAWLALHAAAENRPHGIVLESPIGTLDDIAKRPVIPLLPWFQVRPSRELRDGFRPLPAELASKCHAPVLVLHGEDDRISLETTARALVRAANSIDKALFVVPGAGHNDIDLIFGSAADELHSFVDRIARSSS